MAEHANGQRTPAYRRILLKLSGEALLGTASFGIDLSTLDVPPDAV